MVSPLDTCTDLVTWLLSEVTMLMAVCMKHVAALLCSQGNVFVCLDRGCRQSRMCVYENVRLMTAQLSGPAARGR